MYTDYTEENNENYYEEKSNNNGNEKIKKIVILVLIFVVTLILIVLFVKGCSKNNNRSESNYGNTEPTIAINRSTITLEVGETFELHADVLFSKTGKLVGWYSEASSIAVVDDNGVVSAISEGTTNIVAFYEENGKVYSSKCNVTVTSKIVPLKSINIIQENITLKKGNSVLLEISLEPVDAKTTDLVFYSDNTAIATVNENGFVNAIDYGTTTITVKNEEGTLSDSITVNVTETGTTVINPVSLQLVGLSNGISVGKTAEVLKILLPSNATNQELVWSSSNPSIATVNNGIVTGVSAGTCKIIASTTNNISSSIEITVQPNVVAVEEILVKENSINMQTGETRLINYTIKPDNATNKKVLYTTSNSNIVYVNSNGIMAAVSAGEATITITTEDGKKTATINVTVTGESSNSSTQTGSSENSSGNSSNGSSENSSSSSSSVSCRPDLMTNIEHNGKKNGAIVSTIKFSQAKPFTGMNETPYLLFNDVADCLDKRKVTYEVYYGSDENNIVSMKQTGTVDVGTKIYLNRGSGYYKIMITGYLSSNLTKKLTKYYYAIVGEQNNILKSNYKYYDYSTKMLYIDYSDNKLASDAKIRYCITQTECTPTSSSYQVIGNSVAIPNIEMGRRICSAIFVNDTITNNRECSEFTTAPTITISSSLSGNTLSLTPTLKTSGSGNANIHYCITTENKKCDARTSSIKTISGRTHTWKIGSEAITRYVCFQAVDSKGNSGNKICYDIVNNKLVV